MDGSSGSTKSAAHATHRGYLGFVLRHRWVIVVGALLVAIVSIQLARGLKLKTSFIELLPSNDPGVVTLTRTQQRMGDMSLLLLGVHSPNREANLRYAELLTQKLRQLPPTVLELASYHVKDLKSFFEANKWLYLSEPDLIEIRDRLKKEIAKRKNPLLLDLDDDEESVDAMRTRISSQDRLGGRFPGGLFSNADGSFIWIAALPPGGIFVEGGGEALYRAALRLVAENDPRAFAPDMTAEVTGPVATAILSRQAVERDILWVTCICVVLVVLSIGLYFRRLRIIPMIGIPAAIGTLMAFAVARVAFGYLNSSTAFLGSIILGNGINYSIILVSRYQEERAAGLSSVDALGRAISGSVHGTGVAAVCASGAYTSLMLTSFRGFYQFGVMGAVGVLSCWAATFTILPVLVLFFDSKATGPGSRRAPLQLRFLGPLLRKGAFPLLLGSVVVTVLAAVGLTHFLHAPFEYDFRKLNAELAPTAQAAAFNRSHEQLFGRWPSPTPVLADSLDEVESIRKAIRKQDEVDPRGPVIGQIVTVYDVLPGTAEQQQRKLGILEEIRHRLADKALETVSDADRKKLDELRPPEHLGMLVPQDLPPLVRRPFTELDGTVGRVVLVYPREKGVSIWDGRDLLRIAAVLQNLHLEKEGKNISTSGSAVVFGAMIRAVLRDGPRATAASLAMVIVLILLVMRPPSAAGITIMTLLAGVTWMMGAAGWAQVRITFLNFIALPITFGIGAEYALNVVARQREQKDMIRAVVATGSAVALCSWTTIVGYGSLLAARNRALKGFGAMAILGEVACLSAALIALPSLVLWWQRRQSKTTKTEEARSVA